MENKLSELSKPVAEVVSKFGDLEAFGEREIKLLTGIQQMAYGTKFYSQEYVTALLAELEAKDGQLDAEIRAWTQKYVNAMARIAELEAIATEYAGKFQKAQDAAKHLVIMNDSAQAEIAHLKTLLATPVRLPVVLMGYQSDDYRIGFMEGVEKSGEEVRAAGFTVEGGE